MQKDKRCGGADYDLTFLKDEALAWCGDLKATNVLERDALGNDTANLRRWVSWSGRFWQVIYEHETLHGRTSGEGPVRAWNALRESLGHTPRKEYDPLSYARKFKSAVRFVDVKIVEVNEVNLSTVLGDFDQDHQTQGAPRAPKVRITKRMIDNFLVFSMTIGNP